MRWPAGQCRCGEVNGQVVRGAGTDEVRWLNQRALRGGGSGGQSRMYLDWSGYCPASVGGAALRDGGSPCANPNSNPTFKPHTVVNLDPTHWYRLTVRKVP